MIILARNGTGISICVNNPADTLASFSVDLARSGDKAVVTVPGSAPPLVLTLDVAPLSATGTITGSARDAAGVLIGASGTVTGIAPPDTAIAVSGTIDGQVSVTGGACTNNGHRWSLTRR